MKKLLLSLLLLLWLARPGFGAIAVANSGACHSKTAGQSTQTTSAVDCTGANLFVVHLGMVTSVSNTLSDSTTALWDCASVTPQTVGINLGQLCFAKNVTGSATQTFTLTCTNCFFAMEAIGFSGADISAPLDQQSGSIQAAASTIQAGSVTPGSDGQVIVSGVEIQAGDLTSVDLSFVISDHTANSGSNVGSGMAYLIETTATAKNPTDTMSGSSSLAAINATFKAAATGATCRGRLTLLGVAGC